MNALFMKVFSRDTILSLGNIHEIELYVASLNEDMHYHLLELQGDLDSKLTRKHIFDVCCPPGAVQLSNEFHGQVAHFAGQDPRIEPSYALLTDFEKVSKLFTFSRAAALRIQALYDFTPNLSKKSEHPFLFTAFHLGYQSPGVCTYPNMDDDKYELTKRYFKYFKTINIWNTWGQSRHPCKRKRKPLRKFRRNKARSTHFEAIQSNDSTS